MSILKKDEGCPYFENEKGKAKHMLVVQDVYSQWLQAYPVARKDHESVLDCVLIYFGPEYHPNYSGPGARRFPVRCTLTMPMSLRPHLGVFVGSQIPALPTRRRPLA